MGKYDFTDDQIDDLILFAREKGYCECLVDMAAWLGLGADVCSDRLKPARMARLAREEASK